MRSRKDKEERQTPVEVPPKEAVPESEAEKKKGRDGSNISLSYGPGDSRGLVGTRVANKATIASTGESKTAPDRAEPFQDSEGSFVLVDPAPHIGGIVGGADLPTKKYRVKKTTRAMTHGGSCALKEGKVLDSRSWDIAWLKAQGVQLEEVGEVIE